MGEHKGRGPSKIGTLIKKNQILGILVKKKKKKGFEFFTKYHLFYFFLNNIDFEINSLLLI